MKTVLDARIVHTYIYITMYIYMHEYVYIYIYVRLSILYVYALCVVEEADKQNTTYYHTMFGILFFISQLFFSMYM